MVEVSESESEDESEGADDEEDVAKFMEQEKQKLEAEKAAIMNNKSLISEVRNHRHLGWWSEFVNLNISVRKI